MTYHACNVKNRLLGHNARLWACGGTDFGTHDSCGRLFEEEWSLQGHLRWRDVTDQYPEARAR